MGLGNASAGLGLHHQDFLQTTAQPTKHCFLEGVGGIQARLIFAHFGAKRCRAWRRCWVLALQNAVNTVENCCAEICPFCFCCGWLARCAVLAFFPLVFGPYGAHARDPSKTVLFTAFCCICVAALFGLLFLGPLARARYPMSAFWVGARLGPRKLTSPASSGVGVGDMHNPTSHIIAQETFLIQKHDMTCYNFKAA